MRFKFLILGLISFLCFLSVTLVSAQQESTSILMNVVPSNPAPGESVSIILSSYAENLDTATITWFVDGKNTLSGIGEKKILLNAPNLGLESKIVAKIKLQYEETQVSTIIKPSQMVILWQAVDSYVPPFYKGKALPTPDSFVKVVAFPEIRVSGLQVDPKSMTYSWQKDFENISQGLGYGKNFFTFKNDYFENYNNIGVTAFTLDQKYSSKGNLDIRVFDPFVNFYRKDADLGVMWENILADNYFITSSDIIVAEPYFISPKDIRRPDLSFLWHINNTPISTNEEKRNLLPVIVEEGTSGTSKIKVEIENVGKLLRAINKEINISF